MWRRRQPLLGGGAQQQQLALLAPQESYQSSRAVALQSVERTIHELGAIFQDLALMVRRSLCDQGWVWGVGWQGSGSELSSRLVSRSRSGRQSGRRTPDGYHLIRSASFGRTRCILNQVQVAAAKAIIAGGAMGHRSYFLVHHISGMALHVWFDGCTRTWLWCGGKCCGPGSTLMHPCTRREQVHQQGGMALRIEDDVEGMLEIVNSKTPEGSMPMHLRSRGAQVQQRGEWRCASRTSLMALSLETLNLAAR